MINRETIEKIFDTARIEEVIGDFVSLKRSGSNLKGLSPFTQERTPSFMVSPSKQIFKDFSSGKGGNVVSFLMEHEHLTYPEALRYLAKRYNIEIEESEQTDEEKLAESEKESMFILTQAARDFFENQLHETDEGKSVGLSYFKQRGFSEQTIKTFQLGYSPEQMDAFCKYAIDKGYQPTFLEKTGLGIQREGGRGWIDRFRGRVMFPIHNLTGRVIGFGGRILRADAKVAKYLNSPESELYHKSKVLFGMFQAKNAIVKADNCYLVEGYTDVLSLHQSGIQNVVASSGTALTKEQIQLIKRYTPNITVLYDGDRAGINASFKGLDMILEQGMNARALVLPNGEDPDSFVRSHSTEEVEHYLATEKQDFIRFKAQVLKEDVEKDPIRKNEIVGEIIKSIAKIPGESVRFDYIRDCSRIFNIEEIILQRDLAQKRSKYTRDILISESPESKAGLEVLKGPRRIEEEREESGISLGKDSKEEELIEFFVRHGHKKIVSEENEGELKCLAEFVIQEFERDKIVFTNPILRKIVAIMNEAILNGDGISEQTLMAHRDPEVIEIVARKSFSTHKLDNWLRRGVLVPEYDHLLSREVVSRVEQYKFEYIDELLSDLNMKVKKELQSVEEKEAILQEIMRLVTLRGMLAVRLTRTV